MYCPECGNEVSITDKRCSKCGTKLDDNIDSKDFVDKIKGTPKDSNKTHHNIEFGLAIITIVLTVFSVSQSLNDYSFTNTNLLLFVLILIFIGIIGTIITRYFAKPGATIVLISCFLLILSGVKNMSLPIIFSVITIIVAFILN